MVLRAVHSLGSTTLVLVESNWYSVCQVDGSRYSMTYAVGAQPYLLDTCEWERGTSLTRT